MSRRFAEFINFARTHRGSAMSEGTTTLLQKWIDRLNAHDPTARDELINHSCERLRRLTRVIFTDFRRVRTFEDSADVLQNAVLRLMRTLVARIPESVQEFFRLASRDIRRELIDLARHYYGPEGLGANQQVLGAAVESSEAARPVDRADGTHDPSLLASWAEFHRRVEHLPAKERDVVNLLWYQGLTQEDAAQLLEVSLSTVKRRWTAARLQLNDVFDTPTV